MASVEEVIHEEGCFRFPVFLDKLGRLSNVVSPDSSTPHPHPNKVVLFSYDAIEFLAGFKHPRFFSRAREADSRMAKDMVDPNFQHGWAEMVEIVLVFWN